MKDKLVLVNIKEDTRKAAYVNVYGEAHEILKSLRERTGMSFALLANKMICFAADYIVVEGEENEKNN